MREIDPPPAASPISLFYRAIKFNHLKFQQTAFSELAMRFPWGKTR